MKLRTRHMNRALSTVLTTIIILVASVVLATGVVLYGTSLFQTSTQQEAISVTGMKVWVHATDSNDLSWGAFTVRNTGDKILSVNKISVRGGDIPFTQWYPDTNVTSTDLQQTMNFTSWSGTAGFLANNTGASCSPNTKMEINLAVGVDFCANAASGPVGLEPGKGAIIYFSLTNGTITSLDAGISTAVGVFAGKSGAPISITVASKT
ncbi:MAG: hypothetical protein IH842_00875 [Thaumarchaeota archaeon]|nr:hypothetical protein [Nitrososphaerota archaeon]